MTPHEKQAAINAVHEELLTRSLRDIRNVKHMRISRLPDDVTKELLLAGLRKAVDAWAEVCAKFPTRETSICRSLARAEQQIVNALEELTPKPPPDLTLGKSRDTAAQWEADHRDAKWKLD